MKKKLEEKVKKTELAVVQEPTVNHSVNLSLSSSDLIELYIEENSQRIVEEATVLLEELKNKKEDDTKEKIDALIIKTIKCPFFEVKRVSIDYNWSELNKVGILCNKIRLAYHYNGKNTEDILKHKDTYSFEENVLLKKYTVRKICLHAEKGYTMIGLEEEYLDKTLVKAIEKIINKSITEQEKEINSFSSINKRIAQLSLDYKELNNTRKVKAKFTKKALGQTEQGKKLLEFVTNAGNLSLLD